MRSRLSRTCLAAFPLVLVASVSSLAATAPPQPKTGPGAPLYPDAEIVKRAVGRASAATYVFHTAGAPAEPRSVVVLLHGWGAVNPGIYGAWIDHLARRGHLVLFPAFQDVGKIRPVDATDKAATLVKDSLAALASDPVARPDPARVAYIGHSAGAGIAANLAAVAKAKDLPAPKLLFLVMPGGVASDEKAKGVQLLDLATVDAGTAMVTMIGDREFQAADRTARRILRAASEVPLSRKLFMRAGSDDHGFPSLSATLASPAAGKDGYDAASIKVPPDPPVDPKAARSRTRPVWSADMVLTGEQTVLVGQLQRNALDALDYLAYWRTFDMAAQAAFTGQDMATLRANPALTDMGRWSDSWPVRRMSAETPKVETPAATAATAPVAAPAPAPRAVPQQPRRRQAAPSR